MTGQDGQLVLNPPKFFVPILALVQTIRDRQLKICLARRSRMEMNLVRKVRTAFLHLLSGLDRAPKLEPSQEVLVSGAFEHALPPIWLGLLKKVMIGPPLTPRRADSRRAGHFLLNC